MPYIGNSPGTGTRNRFIFTATASQTTFSGADDNGKTLAYSDGDYVDVYLNGICLVPVDDYAATSKTSIVLTVGAAASDTLEVVAYDIATIADTVSKANGGTFEGEVNMLDTLTVGNDTQPSMAGQLSDFSIASIGTDFLTSSIIAQRFQSGNLSGPSILLGKSRGANIGDMDIVQDDDELGKIRFYGSDGSNMNSYGAEIEAFVDGTPGSGDMPGRLVFSTAADGSSTTTERMRIDSSGNVGIGSTSPTSRLEIRDETDISMNASGTGHLEIDGLGYNFAIALDGDGANLYTNGSSRDLIFGVDETEVMRVGNGHTYFGGKSTLTVTDYGAAMETSGNSVQLSIHRQASDGRYLEFYRGGTFGGCIFADGGYTAYTGSGTGLQMRASDIIPTNGSGTPVDNTEDLGDASYRFDDVFATNGTIQTSDQNEKQQIASLTDAEITAAKAISKLFKTFKWNSAVEAKGDAARTHSGVIAQDVEQAMTDAGLNAGDYAFFISSNWWEADGETYETAEEAPEGATERNRKGIRYPELLSFIGAATEQRLASIESRLDALEAN